MIPSMLADMFRLDMPVVEKVLRTIVVYLLLLGLLRLAGRRELAQLNPFDLVLLLMLSNTVQNAIIGDDNSLLGGALGAVVLIGFNQLVVRFFYRHQAAERSLEGEEEILIQNGRLNEGQLKKELITRHQLLVAARAQGFDTLDEVESADINSAGSFIFTRKRPTEDEQRQQELLDRLDRLAGEMAEIRAALARLGR
ncbi:DUF421 domain-containing protein [Chloroflexia bacterium SDU3-3]|nr:DUF421 domain-containing protein [Chloroflexia bacterium SDU3-3]